jgi:multidrug efflux pump subunit AcrB/uncharacterized protein YqeY
MGYLSFKNTGVDLLPNINLPYIVVATVYPGGSSPDAVEERVTRPLEQVLSSAGSIKSISTESYSMISLIILELKSGANTDSVLLDINAKIDTFKTLEFGTDMLGNLGSGTSDTGLNINVDGAEYAEILSTILDPVVMVINASMLPVMKLSLYKEGQSMNAATDELNEIAKKLEGVDGVASVDVTGLVNSMYFLNVDNGRILKSITEQFVDTDVLFEALYSSLQSFTDVLAEERLTDETVALLDAIDRQAESAASFVKEKIIAEILIYAGYGLDAVLDIVVNALENNIRQVFDDIRADVGGSTDEVFQNIEDGIIGALDGVKATASDAVDSGIDGFKSVLYDALDGLNTAANDFIDGYVTANPGVLLPGVADALKGLISSAVDQAKAGVPGVIDEQKDNAAAALDAIFASAEGEIRQALNDIKADIGASITDLISSIEESVISALYGTKDGIKDALISGGKAAAESLIDVILDDYIKAATDSIRQWAENNLPALNAALSPEAAAASEYLKNPQNKAEFKALFKEGLNALYKKAGAAMGEIVPSSLIDLALLASNIEMPVGSHNGAVINVGNTIKTPEELFALPVLTDVKLADFALSGATGGYLYLTDLENLSKTVAVFLIFYEELAVALSDPASTVGDALDGVFARLETMGIQKETLAAVFALAGIDISALNTLLPSVDMPDALTEMLSYLKEANDLLGAVTGELSDITLSLTLGDVCNIVKIDNASLLHTILNGSAGVQFNINKNPAASTAAVTAAVRDKLEELSKADPSLKYVVLEDQGGYIQLVINTILNNLIIGGLLAILILLFFLKKIGPTIVVGMSIVLSLVLAFIMMRAANINLNIASMAGLALGVGMLVDNSIIVMENIFSMKMRGKGIFEAAIEGAGQVTEAIIASTITTIVVFVPLFFADGMNEIVLLIFKDLAMTMSFSILSSLIVAITFVPMAATTFIKNSDGDSPLKDKIRQKFDAFELKLKKRPKWLRVVAAPLFITWGLAAKSVKSRDGKIFTTFKKGYQKVLLFCLQKKAVPLIAVGILFGTAVLSAFFMGMEILPELDMNTINMHIDIDDNAMYAKGIDKNDLLQELMYIADDKAGEFYGKEISDTGISVYSGFKIMGTSIEELGGGLIRTDNLFGGTILSGAVAGGDLECSILLSDKKKRKLSADDIAARIASGILNANYVKTDGGQVIGTYKIADMVSITYSFNTLAEISTLESDNVQLNVFGNNRAEIEEQIVNITKYLRESGIKGVASVENTLENRPVSYRIVIDKDEANKYGLFTANVVLELLNRFSTPSSTNTVTLYDDAADKNFTYNVTVYPSTREVRKWYRTTSTEYKYLYVEDVLVTDDAGVSKVTETYYTYDSIGILWRLTKVAVDGKERYMLLDESGNTATALIDIEKKSDVLYYSAEYRDPIESVYDLLDYELAYTMITGETGKVKLGDIVKEIVEEPAYGKINKTDGSLYLPITVYMSEGANSLTVKSALNKALGKYYDAQGGQGGTSYEFSAASMLINEIFSTLLFVLGIGIVFIYLVMTAQFRSLKEPIIIMLTIPLAFTGSIFALLVFGMHLSIISVIAFIVLAGVVVNNGIVFIDYVNRMLSDGMPLRDAILKTASERLRPILMTALTTIVSLTVMAFDGSQAASILRPMGVASVGGLAFATLLTLIIVPVMLEIFKKNDGKKTKKKWRPFADNYEYFKNLEKQKGK